MSRGYVRGHPQPWRYFRCLFFRLRSFAPGAEECQDARWFGPFNAPEDEERGTRDATAGQEDGRADRNARRIKINTAAKPGTW
ncbi:hypothetical protein NDU88_002283 [Pleurodeles waltl]|uniref:Uncharacterized protein n=1 Tax=Pleurodeles waltl TaxID=8319 RepID=A0AAV7WR77_PLEWA|nr:hypothetical protein NDU88_002283 [Pleurodeles waltl]